MNILVVGAGFAGAVAARELAEAGHTITIVDKRNHIAGNAYDYINELGIRVHKYGPHLWHTSNDEVQEWASRFTEWVPYQHRVRAQLKDGRTTPLPVNDQTIEDVFGDSFIQWALDTKRAFYDFVGDIRFSPSRREVAAAYLEVLVSHHADVTNSKQHVENSVGSTLSSIFFEPYTKKMWGLSLEDLPASVAARIPTNVESGDDRYFPNDKHQYLPAKGYTEMVRRILDHANIELRLNTTREQIEREYSLQQRRFDHIFSSEPIDVYFNCSLGPLPWRSIKMHTYSVPVPKLLDAVVMNFTHDGPYTRVTEWKQLPAHGDNPWWTTITVEEPCDYLDNAMERYYPVKTTQEPCPYRDLFKRYKQMAENLGNITFIGRCGQFAYIDMHMAISSSLHAVRRFLSAAAP
jgi:UDP-galactopyranose mutase